MQYESLIFDIDGTLWDSRALVAEGYNRQLRKEGMGHLNISVETLKGLFGKPLPEIGRLLFTEIPDMQEREALIYRCTQSQDQYLQENPCQVGYPQVSETIQALAESHRLFIVSNSEKGYPELCMDKLGLTPYITGHLCYGDTHMPKGQTIRTLMEKYKITSAAYIGDTQGDYEATLDAGIPFIFASYGFGQPEGWTEKIQKISDLLAL